MDAVPNSGPYAQIIDLIQAGRLGEATRLCTRRFEEESDDEALYYLGIIALRVGKFADAVTLLEEARARFPDRPDIAYNFGVALRHVGDLERAIEQWAGVVQQSPDHGDAKFNLARAYADTGRLTEAERVYRAILAAKPGDPGTAYNLANTLFRARRWQDAAALYTDILSARPDHVEARINLVLALQRMGDITGAIREGRRAVALAPESPLAHWNLSHALLMDDRPREGFAEFEWRRRLQNPPITIAGQSEWTGFPLQGKRVVAYGEQGHGDVLQFLRFVPRIQDAGGIAHVVCHPKLVRLAERSHGVASASAFGSDTPDFDHHVPLLSLPHILGIASFETLPQPPYVQPLRNLDLASPHSMTVGFAWRGNPEHDDDVGRSCPLDLFASLFDIDGIDWVNLQFDGGRKEIARVSPPPSIRDGTTGREDFLDTAEVLKDLDLVISVDTALVHLAGAMDIPVWVLLSNTPDWRWLARGSASPWYPSAKLFRQANEGDWPAVIAKVRDELFRFAFMR